jgi:hypothetical protein
MMPNFAGVEKFFAHMTFKASGAAGHFAGERAVIQLVVPEPLKTFPLSIFPISAVYVNNNSSGFRKHLLTTGYDFAKR